MDSLTFSGINAPLSSFSEKQSIDAVILDSIDSSNEGQAAKVDFSINDLGKSLSVTAQEVISKLNALLEQYGSKRIEDLDQERYTPEATAERIVSGATAFFDIYAAQNPELQGEELVTSFMETIRSGIDQGYSEAFEALEGLGAFEFDGVQGGIEETKTLIESKLLLFEETKRRELGLSEKDIQSEVAQNTTEDIYTGTKEKLSLEVIA